MRWLLATYRLLPEQWLVGFWSGSSPDCSLTMYLCPRKRPNWSRTILGSFLLCEPELCPAEKLARTCFATIFCSKHSNSSSCTWGWWCGMQDGQLQAIFKWAFLLTDFFLFLLDFQVFGNDNFSSSWKNWPTVSSRLALHGLHFFVLMPPVLNGSDWDKCPVPDTAPSELNLLPACILMARLACFPIFQTSLSDETDVLRFLVNISEVSQLHWKFSLLKLEPCTEFVLNWQAVVL